jgi:branched-chain amino acid transport system substrate-binding protein
MRAWTRRVRLISIVVAMCWALSLTPGWGQTNTVLVGIVGEITGPGATVGANWRDGALLSIKDVNAHGGILGRQIRAEVLDTQTQPTVAAAALRRIAAEYPFVVLGPVYSSSTLVAMKVLEDAKIPEFVGSEDDHVIQQDNPYLFMTSYSAGGFMRQLTKWIAAEVKPKTIAIIYSNDAAGKSNEAAFVADINPYGVPIAADIATAVGQTDFTGELTRVSQSGADVLFLTSHEAENARIAEQLKTLGLSLRLVGASTLMSADTLQLAGAAMNGAGGIVQEEAVAPPFHSLGAAFRAAYGRDPSHDAIKAYLAIQIARVVADATKTLDTAAFIHQLHGMTMQPAKYPSIPVPIHVGPDGSFDSPAYPIQVQDGRFVVTGQFPPLNPGAFNAP